MKEHVQKMESGGMFCAHCGGKVDGDGYADGGEVQDGDHDMDSELEAMLEGDTGEVPQQWQATKRLRDGSGFADAVRRRAR